MKTIRNLFVLIFLSPFVTVLAQPASEFIVVDEIADNITQLQDEFEGQANVFWTDGNSLNALEQISAALEGRQIENLHIYVPTKPGAIVFSSLAITSMDVYELSEELNVLGNYVSNSVVIHSDVVFNGEEGQLLKQRLEEVSGIVFTVQN